MQEKKLPEAEDDRNCSATAWEFFQGAPFTANCQLLPRNGFFFFGFCYWQSFL